jgi:hypothetical protein
MEVTAEGIPNLSFVDVNGKTIGQMGPTEGE